MTETAALNLTDADISGVYAELATLHVELDDDPLLYGPKRLNAKVAKTRTMLTRCEQIFLELSRRLHWCQRELRKQNTLLEMAKQDLLANDPEVRAGRNIADRDAIAAIKLRTQIEQVHKLETASTDLETVLAVVKVKRLDLKDLQNRLKDQIKLCQDEIGLGSRWGATVPPSEQTTTLQPGQLGSQPLKVDPDDVYSEIEAHLATNIPDEPKANYRAEPEPEIGPEPIDTTVVLPSTATQEGVDSALDSMDFEDATTSFLDDLLDD